MSAREDIVTSNAIDRIVVVGGGTAGWMAAAAFSRYFDNGRRKVVVVESDAIGTVGVGEATIPAIKSFNAMLDIPENEFLRETRGTFKLGIEFVDWGRQGDRYIHPFGTFGSDLHGIPFHQLWLREHARGGGGRITDYSMSAAAASLGRFGRPAAGARSPISRNQLRLPLRCDALCGLSAQAGRTTGRDPAGGADRQGPPRWTKAVT